MKLFTGIALFALAASMQAQQNLGIFESQTDIGKVLNAGSASYDNASRTYTLSGSGENMWFGKDEFYFVYKKISADDLTLSATITALDSPGGKTANAHRKGVLMVRQSLDGDSAYADVARHAEGLTSLQYREKKGAITHEIESNTSGPAALRIEKRGPRFFMWVAQSAGEEMQFSGGSAWVEMHAPFYVGIGVCSHDKNTLEKFSFADIEIDTKPKRHKGSYSTVETVLLSGDARSAFVANKHLTYPGWTSDGAAITFEDSSHQQSVPFTPLRTAATVKPPVPVVKADFTYFTTKSGDTQQIWRKSADGSQSSQFTPEDFNNVSPYVSPDGKYLLFLSFSREYKKISDGTPLELRLMSFKDNSIKTLVSFVGGPDSLGAQPWSPDGQRIVFISYQPMSNLNMKF